LVIYFHPPLPPSAFFVFLLRRCLSSPLPFLRVLLLGLSVLSTFAVLWLPFCLESDEGCVAGLGNGEEGRREGGRGGEKEGGREGRREKGNLLQSHCSLTVAL